MGKQIVTWLELRVASYQVQGIRKKVKGARIKAKGYRATLISKNFFVGTQCGKHNSHFSPDVSCSIVHGNAKCPLVSSL
jgi:hypothetical protein